MDSGWKAARLSSAPPRSRRPPQHPLPPIAPKHSSSSSERPCRSPLSKSHSPQKKKAQPNGPCLTVVLLPTPSNPQLHPRCRRHTSQITHRHNPNRLPLHLFHSKPIPLHRLVFQLRHSPQRLH